jgi:DNA-binding response OmpR family regulator
MTGKRLLIVDDDPEICAVVIRVAQRKGFEARGIHSVAEFAGVYGEFRPSLLILDLAMPDTDGIELTRLLAASGAVVPILFMSGFETGILESARRLAEARGLNVVGTIQKPVRAADLARLLDEIAGTP